MVNTDSYLLLGLAVVFGVALLYSASLVVRFRQAHKMIETLEALQDK
jgi:hypothetical protein